MKTFICYNERGEEIWFTPKQQYIKAGGHNAAEKKAKAKHGPKASVVYTEI